jgi:hypothetical protein
MMMTGSGVAVYAINRWPVYTSLGAKKMTLVQAYGLCYKPLAGLYRCLGVR